MFRWLAGSTLLTLSLLTARLSAAQTPLFVLSGHVTGPGGQPIPGAEIVAIANAGGTPVSARADASANFRLELPSGTYTLIVTSPGMTEARETVLARAGGSEARTVALRAGGFEEVVNVSGMPDEQRISTATRTDTPLRDVPQAVTVVTRELIDDQLMTSLEEVVRYVPGIGAHQGENNRDQIIIRGNSSSADFFVDGVRDDVQYYRDLYNVERVEALKGPNALMFGRGGGGGIVNRVMKAAGFVPISTFTLQGGSFGQRRLTADFNRPVAPTLAFRLNGVYENSDSFRRGVGLERGAVTPAVTFRPSERSVARISYEYLSDTRVADRGIPSRGGRPVDVDPSTYYGDADNTFVRARVHALTGSYEHHAERLTVSNRSIIGHYTRAYQNYVPGAVAPDASTLLMTAYNNSVARLNLFSQTDLIYDVRSGPIRHKLVAGVEVGHQSTDNFRNTGFFNDVSTSATVPFNTSTVVPPVSFRQSATDADNHVMTNVVAAYVQDQVGLTPHFLAIAGVRVDRFDLEYHNNRTSETLGRVDTLVSPRAGLIFKPGEPMSVYGSYSVSQLPASGDQFSSLTNVTQQLKPERFGNYEVGAKWDASSRLAITGAIYRLDRTNTRSTDPADPTRIVQTGSQRTNGVEIGVNGRLAPHWTFDGGYAHQDAFVATATTAAAAGARVAQVPRHSLSLWSQWDLPSGIGVAAGIVSRTDMFAAIDDTVTLQGYARFDASAFWTFQKRLRLQVNVENLLDRRYFADADGNTNISPGSPRAVRAAMRIGF